MNLTIVANNNEELGCVVTDNQENELFNFQTFEYVELVKKLKHLGYTYNHIIIQVPYMFVCRYLNMFEDTNIEEIFKYELDLLEPILNESTTKPVGLARLVRRTLKK